MCKMLHYFIICVRVVSGDWAGLVGENTQITKKYDINFWKSRLVLKKDSYIAIITMVYDISC